MSQFAHIHSMKALSVSFLALLMVFTVSGASAAALPPAAQPGASGQGFVRPERPSRSEVEIPAVQARPDILFDGLDAGVRFAIDSVDVYKIESSGGQRVREIYADAEMSRIIQNYIAERNGDFTFGYLQDLANQLTDSLRRQGLLLATVYVPSQKVANASVEFELLLGELTDIEVVGNEMYNAKYLTRAFEGSKGKVVDRADMEESMLLLQEFPGLSASGLLSPGDALGQSRMRVSVNAEERFSGLLITDNYGSEFTGKARVGAHFEVNNPLNMLDKLTVDIFAVERASRIDGRDQLQDRLYGNIRYEARPFNNRWGIGFEASANSYEVGSFGAIDIGGLNITGINKSGRVFLVNNLHRSRTGSMDLEFGMKLEEATTEQAGDPTSLDDLTTFDLSLNFQRNDSFLGGCRVQSAAGSNSRQCNGVTLGGITFVHGVRNYLGSMGDGSDPSVVRPSRLLTQIAGQPDEFADAKFLKIEYDLLRFQELTYFDVLLTVSGQHTNEALYSVEQATIGGPFNVRAYPTGAFLADKAIYAGLEISKQIQAVSLSVFYDYSSGENFDVLANQPDKVNLEGVGIGVSFESPFLSKLNIDFSVAWAVGSDLDIDIGGETVNGVRRFGRDATDRRDPMFFGNLSYRL